MTRPKLLLADDSVTIRKVVELTFADEGIDVSTASDADTAMQKFVESHPDIVLVDVGLHGTSGYLICEMIKQDEATAHIPVLLLVGSFEPFDQDEAERVGADGFLTKPFHSIRDLVERVWDLIGKDDVAELPAAPSRVETDDIDSLYQSSISKTAEIRDFETVDNLFGDAGMDDEMIETDFPSPGVADDDDLDIIPLTVSTETTKDFDWSPAAIISEPEPEPDPEPVPEPEPVRDNVLGFEPKFVFADSPPDDPETAYDESPAAIVENGSAYAAETGDASTDWASFDRDDTPEPTFDHAPVIDEISMARVIDEPDDPTEPEVNLELASIDMSTPISFAETAEPDRSDTGTNDISLAMVFGGSDDDTLAETAADETSADSSLALAFGGDDESAGPVPSADSSADISLADAFAESDYATEPDIELDEAATHPPAAETAFETAADPSAVATFDEIAATPEIETFEPAADELSVAEFDDRVGFAAPEIETFEARADVSPVAEFDEIPAAPEVETFETVAGVSPVTATDESAETTDPSIDITVPAEASQDEPAAAAPLDPRQVSADLIAQIAERVLEKLSENVIREIARDEVPRIAEKLIREALEDTSKG